MKKFKFSLDSVLSYKQQVLDALQGEHAALLAQVRAQEEVLDAVQAIEAELGRDRAAEQREKARSGAAYVSRPIDIDILFYDDLVLASERLALPHPLLAEREFALVPLCEIMRSRRHPVSGRTMGELLDDLKRRKSCDNE